METKHRSCTIGDHPVIVGQDEKSYEITYPVSPQPYFQHLDDDVFAPDELRPNKGEIESLEIVTVTVPSLTPSLGPPNYSRRTRHPHRERRNALGRHRLTAPPRGQKDEIIESSSILTSTDTYGASQSGYAVSLAGLGGWCKDSPKRLLSNDTDSNFYKEIVEAEKKSVKAQESKWPRSENQDVIRRGPSSSSGRTSEYVPSLVVKTGATGNISAFGREPSTQNPQHPCPPSDPSLPRAEISSPEIAHLTDDDQYFPYDKPTEQFTTARQADLELSAICTIGVQEGDRFDDDSDIESAEELWLSDYSNHTLTIEENHPVWQRHGKLLLRAILLAFQKRGESCDQEQDDHNQSHDTQNLCSSSSQLTESQAVSNKRSFNKYSEDDTQDRSESLETSSKNSRPRNQKRLFACPFCKKNPLRYRSCYSVRLTKISYVKQHISKNHPFPTYCSVCMEIFETPHVRDAHTRAQNCQRRPLVGWEGVTEVHRQQMRRKPPKGTSEEEQWFMIFKMLFPELPCPSSPYIDGDLSEQLFAFQDFAVSQGPNIVRETLGPLAETLFLIDVEPLIQRVVTEGIPAIVQHFISSRQSRSESGSMSPINEPTRSCGPISNGNFALPTNYEGSNNDVSNGARRDEGGSDITVLRDSAVGVVAQATSVPSDGQNLQRNVTEAGGMKAFDSLPDAQMRDLSDEIQGYLNDLVEAAETDSWINNDYYEAPV